MNKQEYANYEASVRSFLRGNSVKDDCHSKVKDDAHFFSWRRCECCLRPVGGDRETYEFATDDGEKMVADICSDCVYYLTYGQLDDATMQELSSAPLPELFTCWQCGRLTTCKDTCADCQDTQNEVAELLN